MIYVQHLFAELDQHLIELLKSLDNDSWKLPTSAKLWNVKDVAAHLLDTNLRTLSIQRDKFSTQAPPDEGFSALVGWLNKLNAEWVAACKNLSPTVLIYLLEQTGAQVSTYYESLDLQEKAVFPVAWAGEENSLNWMHLAREYTEKWHYQQQIREAVKSDLILAIKFFEPVMDTFLLALPSHYKNIDMRPNLCLKVLLTGAIDKAYFLNKMDKDYYLSDSAAFDICAEVVIDSEIAWKLLCKNIKPSEVQNHINIWGDRNLGIHFLNMVTVMA